MGSDEHGPAYPEPPRKPYRCPICRGDANRYSSCDYPGCYDGRDSGHPYAKYLASLRPREEPGDPHLDHAIGPRTSPDYLGLVITMAILFGLYWVLK